LMIFRGAATPSSVVNLSIDRTFLCVADVDDDGLSRMAAAIKPKSAQSA